MLTKTAFYGILFALITLGMTLFGTMPEASAVGGTISDQTSCEGMGGSWTAPDTCTVTSLTINSGQTLTIPNGIMLVISNTGGAGIVNFGGTIDNSGTITVSNSGGTGIVNSGTIGSSTINNSGTITVSNSGTSTGISNSRVISNSGTITVSNNGTIINTGTINNSGTIDNNGTINNFSTIDGSTINNSGTITNSGTIINTSASTIDNSGTITNTDLSTIVNKGRITNSDTIDNSGTIDTSDTISNSGTITNSGTINNGFDNAFGVISNSGTITNLGTINNIVGIIDNTSGTIIHQCGAVYSGTAPLGDPSNFISVCSNILINDVTLAEGNSGTTSFDFIVIRSGDTTGTSTVNFATADGTATLADSDYDINSGLLTFTDGQTTKTVSVLVNGDVVVEPNEQFLVDLSNCVGCIITDPQGIGTITNDDSPPSLSCGAGTVEVNSQCVAEPLSDSDGDGFPDIFDQCDSDPLKIIPGINGCGTPEPDFDQIISDLQNQVNDLTQQVDDLTSQINDLISQLDTIPSGIISSLIADVQSLVSDDTLDEKDSKKIIKELENSLKDLEKGNIKACKDVSKFVKDIDQLIKKGKLSQADAQPLLDEANALLGSCPA
ncbi:MAG TPA: Calx-beta domain-containing protein [Candidatus Nitrosotenuis sp.]